VPTKMPPWWSKRGLGWSSLGMSLTELIIIWGVPALVQIALPHEMHFIPKLVSVTWLIAGPWSFALAVAGLVVDSHRLTAFFAVILAIAAFFICGLRMLV
jgi:hypothetical protein